MDTQIFVNLTTADLERSKRFYEAIGCEINPDFSDETAACVVWNEHVYFMVLTREKFSEFTDKKLVDPAREAQMLVALSRDDREAVDRTLEIGLAAGGTEPHEPRDYGFMYSRDLEDPDGHILEFFYMDPAAVAGGQ